MTRPMGVFPQTHVNSTYYHVSGCELQQSSDWTTHHQLFKYKFHLDNSLRLNITFLNMYFSPGASCLSFGYIVVASKIKSSRPHLYVYCGIYSSISNYPHSNVVDLSVHAKLLILIQVDIMYSIFACCSLRSCHHKIGDVNDDTHSNLNPSPCLVFFVKSKLFLHQYTLRVEHFRKILLTVRNDENIFLFDGPGKNSDDLLPDQRHTQTMLKFSSSTFQVSIHLYARPADRQENTLNYSSSPMIDFHNCEMLIDSSSKQNILSKSNICTIENISIIKLKTLKNLALNISLSDFAYSGESNTEQCDYAGVAMYDVKNKSFEHVSTMCVKQYFGGRHHKVCYSTWEGSYIFAKDFVSCKYTYPNSSDTKAVFSQTHEFLLVVYFYREYGSLQLNVSAHITHCKSAGNKDCSENSGTIDLDWKVPCYIFQLSHRNQLHNMPRHCWHRFVVAKQQIHGKTMSISGAGVLRGDLLTFSRIKGKNICCSFLL